jgi:hypothetical protein
MTSLTACSANNRQWWMLALPVCIGACPIQSQDKCSPSRPPIGLTVQIKNCWERIGWHDDELLAACESDYNWITHKKSRSELN